MIDENKARAYAQELVSNGFNKTRAYEQVSNCSYDSANASCIRFNDKALAIASKGVSIIPNMSWDYIYTHLKDCIEHPKTQGNKLKGLGLLATINTYMSKTQPTDTKEVIDINISNEDLAKELEERVKALRCLK